MNPDPDQWSAGATAPSTMGHAWLNITYYNDDEFKTETAAARRRRSTRRPIASSSKLPKSSTVQGAVRFRAAPFFGMQESRIARSSIASVGLCCRAPSA